MDITRQETPIGELIKFNGTPFAAKFEQLPRSMNAVENDFPFTLRATVFEQAEDGPFSIRGIFEQDCHSAAWLWHMIYHDVRTELRSEAYIHICPPDEEYSAPGEDLSDGFTDPRDELLSLQEADDAEGA